MAEHRFNPFARDIAFTRGLFWFYLLILFAVPLPLGSNRPIFWSVFVAAVAALTLAWGVGWFTGRARWPNRLRQTRWPLIALVLFIVWGGMQMVVLSRPPLTVAPIPVESRAAELLPPTGAAPTGFLSEYSWFQISTVDWQASMDTLLHSLGLLMLAFLTVVLVRSKRRALQVLWILVLAGIMQAIYGSLMLLSGLEWGIYGPKEFGRGVATGTFINRNHYSNLLLLSLSAGVGLLLAQMNLAGEATMRQRLRSFVRAALGPKARLRIFLILMVIALVLTRSRMGNAAFFTSITMVGLFALWRLRKPSRPLLLLVISVLIIDVFVVGTWFGVDKVIDRIQETAQYDRQQWEVNERNRVNANRESLEIISLRPLAGWGGGSFYTVYPAWRGSDQQFMDHTHNDYLEFAVEYGLAGLGLLAWFVLLVLQRASLGLADRDKPKVFGVCFASMMAVVAMLIHATVDFSLHIPANAAWFVVMCLLPFAVHRR